ncbi:MAG: PepSY domain-containing protein [Verrucomicrobia bacterium]|nr:PepSY domain-containing protein [Verrucomicrobiota bacterium]
MGGDLTEMIARRTLRVLFWSHLALGVVAGLAIALLAATGIAMSFESVVIDRMERSLMTRHATPLGAPPMGVDRMMALARERFPDMRDPVLEVRSDPALPWIYRTGRGERHYLHPANGDDLGAGPERARRLFQAVVSLHRWLVWQPEGGIRRGGAVRENEGERREPGGWRKWGGAITSAACLIYLTLALTGLPLWLRGIRGMVALRAKCWFRRGLSGKARDWNWHHVLGWWALPGILTITLTGTIMAYPWANAALFAAFGESPPARASGAPPGESPRQRSPRTPAAPPPAPANLGTVPRLAAERMPGWKTLEISRPAADGGAPVRIIIGDAGRGRPDRRIGFSLTEVGLVPNAVPNGDPTPAARARRWVRWIHTGEAGGWWGQVLAVGVCSATLVLVWTGYALTWRRWTRFRKPMI